MEAHQTPLSWKENAAAGVVYLRTEWLQCIGVVFAGVGAWLLSSAPKDIAKWGWVAFLVSNLFLIAMASRKRLWGMLVLQVFFAWTSGCGIYNHIVDQRLVREPHTGAIQSGREKGRTGFGVD